jgi:hypothetical protein
MKGPADYPRLSFEGGGRVSVDVDDLLRSPNVQRQVAAMRKIQRDADITSQLRDALQRALDDADHSNACNGYRAPCDCWRAEAQAALAKVSA